ncbi:MAG: hypothetical protein M1817_002296 [Caeruleum heppii]|nr:MAG: hypothetical protein M1817_003520 [Caeruleum heppii]KAI9673659.1 MAG: hypothetical protein M1817_002296 [Caeruleum heppii]
MHRQQRPDGVDIPSPPASRSHSVSSDRRSSSRLPALLSPSVTIHPEPAYIAASAASQIVTSDHDSQAYSWFDEDGVAPSGENALVSPGSLKLVNAFLDQLLFNFLCVSRSTSLAALRPAVVEVLKPTLAREAIAGADQELHEYLGGGDGDDLDLYDRAQDPTAEWDPEAAFRRARLRCMVYSSLGDVEEEDEDLYTEQEQQNGWSQSHSRAADEANIPSPAVAIFLTSILEFVGEQALIVAGQAAYLRNRSHKRDSGVREDGRSAQGEVADRIVVEDMDTEKIALNSTLGRLWRTWRKRLRSPTMSFSRAMSRDSNSFRPYQHSRAGSSRRESMDTLDGQNTVQRHSRTLSLGEVLEETMAANIPLPMSSNDVEEIEVPGLVDLAPSTNALSVDGLAQKQRPMSQVYLSSPPMDLPTPASSRPQSPTEGASKQQATASPLTRHRSRSLPTPVTTPLFVDAESFEDDAAFTTPMQSPSEGQVENTDAADKDQAVVEGVRADADDQGSAQGNVDKDAIPHEDEPTISNGQKTDAQQTLESEETTEAFGERQQATVQTIPLADEHVDSSAEITNRELQSGTNEAEAETADSDRDIHEADDKTVSTEGQDAYLARPSGKTETQDSHRNDHGPYGNADEQVAAGDDEDPTAIGLARTSNVSVPAVSYHGSPQLDSDQADYADDYVGAKREASVMTDPEQDNQDQHDGANGAHKAHRVSQFVVTTPPVQRPSRIRLDATREDDEPPQEHLSPTNGSRSVAPEHASPALTPLHELVEANDEYPIDPSSTQMPSSETGGDTVPRANGHTAKSGSVSSVQYSHRKQLSSGSRASDRWQPPGSGQAASPPTDRAAVQRVYTPPVTTRETVSPKVRRSESLGRGPRAVNTPESGSSQVSSKIKGLVTRHHDGAERQSPTVRSSDDERSSIVSAARSQGKAQDFEQLIHSDETIQYTLTPANMRQMEAAAYARSGPPRSETADLADFIKSTGPSSAVHSSDGQSQRSEVAGKSFAALRSNASQPSTSPLSPRSSTRASPSSQARGKAPVSSTVNQPGRIRPGGPTARPARVNRSPTRDLADFLRSTGPDAEAASARSNTSRSGSIVGRPGTATTATSHSTTKKTTNGIRAAVSQDEGVLPGQLMFKSRLMARDAAASARNNSADLIDFIRQGPPEDRNGAIVQGTRGPGVQRKFSTERSPAVSRIQASRVSNSTLSTNHGSLKSQPQSVESSTNSQSGLLRRNADAAGSSDFDEVPMPKRKQRRIKDPYAIDSDSEEDYDITSTPKAKPQRQEESLMDFLRNVPPPNAPTTSSVFDDVPNPNKGSAERKHSLTSTKALLGRAMSSQTSIKSSGVKGSTLRKPAPTSNPSAGRVPTRPPQITLNSSGQETPLGSGSLGMATNGSSRSHLGTGTSNSSSTATPRSPHPDSQPRKTARTSGAPQARAPVASSMKSSTRELADYLRNTGPPPPSSGSTYSSTPAREENGTFSKMLRRMKPSVA